MDENTRIRFLFLDLDYRSYVTLQSAIVCAWAVAAVLFFLFGRGSEVWLWDNAWWICLLAAVLEIFESRVAITRAKKALGDGSDRETT